MNNLVIATFPIVPGKTKEITDFLMEIIPDTRSYKGCISLELYLDKTKNIYTLVQDWESLADYDKYVDWRQSSELFIMRHTIALGGEKLASQCTVFAFSNKLARRKYCIASQPMING